MSSAHLMEVQNLFFAYGTTPVIQDVSLQLKASELTGIIGPNGAGKSTLIRLMLGLLTPESGSVVLQGSALSGLSRRQIATRAALVPQESRLEFSFTVREAVAMGRFAYQGRFMPESDTDRAAIEKALAAADLQELVARPVNELSGGERQRVTLARAIAQQTPLLLLDEPTSNLDVGHQLETMTLVGDLVRQGAGVLAAVHDLSMAARYCSRLLLLSEGRIVAQGPPEDVLTEQHLAAYFHVKAKVVRDEQTQVLMVIPLEPVGN